MDAPSARTVDTPVYAKSSDEVPDPFEYEKEDADPEAFSHLPAKLYHHQDIRTHWAGEPLWDLIILSKLAFHHYLRRKQKGRIHVHFSGHVEPLDPGEFALSIETICEDYLARIGTERPFSREKNPEHEQFYQMIHKRVQRLESRGLLRRVRHVGENMRGRLGTVWSFEGTPLEDFRGTDGTDDRQGQYYAEWRIKQGKHFNPFDLIGEDCQEVAEKKYTYTRTEGATSLDQGRIDIGYFNWTESIAKTGVIGDRYVRMGCESPTEDGWMFPWMRWDIDGDDPFDSYEIARRIGDQLEIEGVNTSEILVAFTGGRGFHVMIPSGMLGNPVFDRKSQAEHTLRQFTLRTIDEEVDHSLFSPYHLARCVGSQHPSTGLYMQARPLSELQRTPILEIMTEARSFISFEMPDPREVTPNPKLVSRIQHGKQDRFWFPPMERVGDWNPESSSIRDEILDRITKGVGKGDAWGQEFNFDYIGRNRAAFEMARHLLKKQVDHPFGVLEKWNQQNDPPLGDHPEDSPKELEKVFKSAQRYV